jgi:AcrR family transcriptional regulator
MTSDVADIDPRPSLRDDARSRARARIVEGASAAVARTGLGATVDEIAAQAGVSRRTVFRHFATHDDLITEVARLVGQGVDALVPESPEPGEDLHAWLVAAMVQLHGFIRARVGRAFWDVYGGAVDLSEEARAEVDRVIARRRTFAESLAAGAWRSLGGPGDPPRWVVDTFDIHASGFTTFSLPAYSPEELGELSARILGVVLAAAVEGDPSDPAR